MGRRNLAQTPEFASTSYLGIEFHYNASPPSLLNNKKTNSCYFFFSFIPGETTFVFWLWNSMWTGDQPRVSEYLWKVRA